jgi:hypothetical protein
LSVGASLLPVACTRMHPHAAQRFAHVPHVAPRLEELLWAFPERAYGVPEAARFLVSPRLLAHCAAPLPIPAEAGLPLAPPPTPPITTPVCVAQRARDGALVPSAASAGSSGDADASSSFSSAAARADLVLGHLVYWAPCSIEQSLFFLDAPFCYHPAVVAYAIFSLRQQAPDRVLFFLPQIVQALRVDKYTVQTRGSAALLCCPLLSSIFS